MKLFFGMLTLCAAPLLAQNIGVGVKGGVPLTDTYRVATSGLSEVKASGDWVFGPMVDLRLPAGLGLELDALYRRSSLAGGGSNGAWEFPLIGKYRLPGVVLRPTVGAGVMWQRLADIPSLSSRTGFVLSGGAEVKVPFLRVAPEIRYTRFNSRQSGAVNLSGSNQVDFLIGLTF